jgi:hypothetical protein
VGGTVVVDVGTVVVVVVVVPVPPCPDRPVDDGWVVAVGATVVTVVDVTPAGVVVTVVVDVVTDWGRVVVVTVVVGDTTVVRVVARPGAAVATTWWVPTAPAGPVGALATSAVPTRTATTAIPVPMRVPIDRRGRMPCRNPASCPCCMAPPSAH